MLADDLRSVTAYMNETFSKPIIGDQVRLNERKTIVTPSVVHKLSEVKSIQGVRSHYCYVVQSDTDYIYFRRYTCTSCVKCKNLEFLKCIQSYSTRGTWKKALIQDK